MDTGKKLLSNKEIMSLYKKSFVNYSFGRTPTNVMWVEDKLFCLFQIKNDSTIMEILNDGTLSPSIKDVSIDKNRKLSKEEILLNQRKRELRKGITSFERVKIQNEDSIMFTQGPNVFIWDLKSRKTRNVSGKECAKVKMDIKFSSNGEFYIFIQNDEIYVQTVIENDDKESKSMRLQLTKGASKEKHITNGIAEYIIQEEFGRNSGQWICPKTIKYKDQDCFLIAYLKVDSSMVPMIKVPEGGFSKKFSEYYFPFPGDKNAISVLHTVTFTVKDGKISNVEDKCHEKLFKEDFKWMEYVIDCGWWGDKLWLKLLDRTQHKFAIVLYNPMNMNYEVVHSEEITKYWVNMNKSMHFFKDGSNRAIIGTEVHDHFLHLLLYKRDDNGIWKIEKRITEGKTWGLSLKDKIHVDEKNGRVYFLATKNSDIRMNLYCVNFIEKGSSKVQLISEKKFYYQNVSFNDSFTKFCSFFSNKDSPPNGSVFHIVETDTHEITIQNGQAISFRNPFVSYNSKEISKPNLFNFKSKRGNTIYGVYYEPRNVDDKSASTLHPMILYMYGGPHVQLVKDKFDLTTSYQAQLYTSLGYYYVVIDSEGSFNRGLEFEGFIKNKMGQIEIPTQIEGIQFLIKEKDLSIDKNRIGIFGYSYGGYMACMGISKFAHFFKVAVAGAPVTDWKLYDTGYTERYMEVEDKEGYEKGSVLKYSNQFPNEPGRFLLMHGQQDENVLFKHSEVLVQELVNNVKPYDFKMYPTERHMFTNPNARVHRVTTQVKYFHDNL